MQWTMTTAMVSDRHEALRADAERLRAGRRARRRRAKAGRSGDVQVDLAARRNGQTPVALAPCTPA